MWGRTLNPHNTALCAGGSSGGEGALLAMRGSAVGIGTDIGGQYYLAPNDQMIDVDRIHPTSSLVQWHIWL